MRRTSVWMMFSVFAMLMVSGAPVFAQMPGMEPPPKREQATGEPVGTVEEVVTPSGQTADDVDMAEVPGLVMRYWARYMGVDSPYRSLVLVILTLLILVNLKIYLTRAMKKKLKEHAFLEENANSFLKVWNGSWKFIITILVRLRYKTIPAKRQELSTYIIEILLREFGKEYPRVRFATPSQTIRHRPDVGAAESALAANSG